MLIEDKASGTQLIQELIEQGLHAVTRYQPQSDKVMRMHAQTAMIENGFVYLPKEAAWLAEYLHELTVFPKGKHDDQVDRPDARVVQARRPGTAGLDVANVQRSPGAWPAAQAPRTVIGDGEEARHSPAVMTTPVRREHMLQMARPPGAWSYSRHPSDAAQKGGGPCGV